MQNWLYPGTAVATEMDIVSGNPLDRTFLTVLISIGLIALIKRKADWGQLARNNIWVFLLFGYMGLSILWSGFPGVSLKRWIRTSGDLIMVLIVLTDPSPIEAIKKVTRRCAYLLIPLSVLFIKYFRHIGVMYGQHSGVTMWVGVTTHKNSLGQLACINAVLLVWNIIKNWKKKTELLIPFIILIMTLWILRGPKGLTSKTALFAFFIGLGITSIILIGKNNSKKINKLILGFTFIYLFLEITSTLIFNQSVLELAVTSSGRDMTLTGRADLWADLFRIASEDFLLGKGYGGFWIGDLTHNLWIAHDWRPESAHNGYIDVYLELGVVGFVIILGIIISSYRNIIRSFDKNWEYGAIRLICFCMILFYNFTESSLTKPTSFLWFIFLLVTVNTSLENDNKVQKEK
jgi:O-antigen ligase